VNRSAALLASLLVTLGRPAWWLLALASFLLRGGGVLLVLPMIAIPSPLAISNLTAPLIVPIAFGRSGATLVVAAIAAIALFAWLVIAGWLAAAIELALLREATDAAIEEGMARPETTIGEAVAHSRAADEDHGRVGFGRAGQVLGVRLVVALPVAATLAVGLVRIVDVAYAELTRPSDVGASLPMRIAMGASVEIAIIAATWIGAELVAGMAALRVAIGRASVRTAIRASIADIVLRPRSNLFPWVASSLAFWLVLGGLLLAARIAWEQAQATMAATRSDGAAIATTLIVFVAVWLIGLTVTGFLGAVRTAVGVFETVRTSLLEPAIARPTADPGRAEAGTFGASAHHRPGDWSVDDEGGSL